MLSIIHYGVSQGKAEPFTLLTLSPTPTYKSVRKAFNPQGVVGGRELREGAVTLIPTLSV